jgi:hypothetical protein
MLFGRGWRICKVKNEAMEYVRMWDWVRFFTFISGASVLSNLLDALDILMNISWLGYRQCSFRTPVKEVNRWGLAVLTHCARTLETSQTETPIDVTGPKVTHIPAADIRGSVAHDVFNRIASIRLSEWSQSAYSKSYLRQPHRRRRLHGSGAFRRSI